MLTTTGAEGETPPPGSGVCVFPCSFAQERLWFLDRLVPGSSSYNTDIAVRFPAPCDLEALRLALNEIVARHEVLRTRFVAVDGRPYQVVAEGLVLDLPVVEVTESDGGPAMEAARRIAAAHTGAAFDLGSGPMLRPLALRFSGGEVTLVVAMHHIVTDGWSMRVFLDELRQLYAAARSRTPSPLSPLRIQYADYAVWQRQRLGEAQVAAEVAWWSEALCELPTIELPCDHPRPGLGSFRGASHHLSLPPGVAGGLRGLARAGRATMFMALLAGFVGLLSRYGAGDDIVVGTPVAGRSRTELEGLIGFFVNTLVLRCDAGGDPSFRQLLARVRSVTLGAFAHQELPFEKLVEELQPERDLSRNPLFQVSFQYQRTGEGMRHWDAVRERSVRTDRDTTLFDLSLETWEGPTELRARFEYATDLFEASTIARMAGHYRRLLAAAVADPDLPLSKLGMLGEAEAEELAAAGRGPVVEVPEACVHELVDARAAACPEAVAVAWEGGSVSYRELVRAANALAWRLRGLGVGPEAVVAVVLARSPELVAALLGVLKAGGAYLPLDPGDPPERLRGLIAGAGAVAVVTTPELSGLIATTGLPVLDAGVGWSAVPGDGRDAAPVSGAGAANLAYVIYTSGSTGTPKGVEVEHASLANLVLWHQRTYAVTPQDRAPLLAAVSFDASVWELWPYLTAGSCLTIPAPQLSTSPGELAAWLASDGVTICFAVTPLAEVLASERLLEATSIRALLTGGDRLHRAAESLPFPLFNHYGPTEATVLATATLVVHDPAQPDAAPPIGRPIANTTAVVLDAHGQMVPAGVAGELCLGGAGLARGYRGRPDLTAQRFVEHPLLGRLYRSGDRARRRGDGQLEFLGRLDDQIKLRGYRIEPGEVEAVLGSHPGVGEVAVVLEHSPHDRLVAYLVAADASRPPAPGELRELAARRLPLWAQPSQVVVVSSLPRTRHGKLDRASLPAAVAQRPEDLAYAAPATPAEQALAAVWAEVLGIEAVGLGDNFFDLGGHSLVAVRLVARIQAGLGIDLPLRSVFDAPTLRAMAGLAGAAAGEARDSRTRPDAPIGALERRRFRVEADGGSLQAAIREHLGSGDPHAGGPSSRQP